jgi:uncharacterized protein (TIGR03437 family)
VSLLTVNFVGLLVVVGVCGQAPAISGVTSAASFSDRQVSTEGYVSVFGSKLADKTYSASPPYETKLGSTEVFVCPSTPPTPAAQGILAGQCKAAAIQYASPTQVNAVLAGIVAGPKYFAVRVNGTLDAAASAFTTTGKAFPVTVLAAAPALFLAGRDCPIDSVPATGGGPRWNGVNQNCGLFTAEPIEDKPTAPLLHPSRANRGVVTDLDGKIVWSGNPARIGNFYTIWLTGLGVISSAKVPDTLRVGWADIPAYGYQYPTQGDAKVTYVGSVPQFPGLYQINFQVPAAIGTGPLGYGAWPCGNYSWELSLNVIFGQSADIVDFPLVIKNGDVPCKP